MKIEYYWSIFIQQNGGAPTHYRYYATVSRLHWLTLLFSEIQVWFSHISNWNKNMKQYRQMQQALPLIKMRNKIYVYWHIFILQKERIAVSIKCPAVISFFSLLPCLHKSLLFIICFQTRQKLAIINKVDSLDSIPLDFWLIWVSHFWPMSSRISFIWRSSLFLVWPRKWYTPKLWHHTYIDPVSNILEIYTIVVKPYMKYYHNADFQWNLPRTFPWMENKSWATPMAHCVTNWGFFRVATYNG